MPDVLTLLLIGWCVHTYAANRSLTFGDSPRGVLLSGSFYCLVPSLCRRASNAGDLGKKIERLRVPFLCMLVDSLVGVCLCMSVYTVFAVYQHIHDGVKRDHHFWSFITAILVHGCAVRGFCGVYVSQRLTLCCLASMVKGRLIKR